MESFTSFTESADGERSGFGLYMLTYSEYYILVYHQENIINKVNRFSHLVRQ